MYNICFGTSRKAFKHKIPVVIHIIQKFNIYHLLRIFSKMSAVSIQTENSEIAFFYLLAYPLHDFVSYEYIFPKTKPSVRTIMLAITEMNKDFGKYVDRITKKRYYEDNGF